MSSRGKRVDNFDVLCTLFRQERAPPYDYIPINLGFYCRQDASTVDYAETSSKNLLERSASNIDVESSKNRAPMSVRRLL